jgi:hypothetical protein
MSEEEKKAYDVKELLGKLKSRGLDLAENAAEMVVEEVADWIVESAALSKTPFDDVVSVVMPMLKKLALDAVDKIDGEPKPEGE